MNLTRSLLFIATLILSLNGGAAQSRVEKFTSLVATLATDHPVDQIKSLVWQMIQFPYFETPLFLNKIYDAESNKSSPRSEVLRAVAEAYVEFCSHSYYGYRPVSDYDIDQFKTSVSNELKPLFDQLIDQLRNNNDPYKQSYSAMEWETRSKIMGRGFLADPTSVALNVISNRSITGPRQKTTQETKEERAERIKMSIDKSIEETDVFADLAKLAQEYHFKIWLEGDTAETLIRGFDYDILRSYSVSSMAFLSPQEPLRLAIQGNSYHLVLIQNSLNKHFDPSKFESRLRLVSAGEINSALGSNGHVRYPLINVGCHQCENKIDPTYLSFYINNESAMTGKISIFDVIKALSHIDDLANKYAQNIDPLSLNKIRHIFSGFNFSLVKGPYLEVIYDLMNSVHHRIQKGSGPASKGHYVRPTNISLKSDLEKFDFFGKFDQIENAFRAQTRQQAERYLRDPSMRQEMPESAGVLDFFDRTHARVFRCNWIFH